LQNVTTNLFYKYKLIHQTQRVTYIVQRISYQLIALFIVTDITE